MSARREPEVRCVLLIGEDDLSEEVQAALETASATVVRLGEPTRDEISEVLSEGAVGSIAVVARQDAFVMRMALLVRSITDQVPLLVTIFDQAMSARVTRQLPNTRVTSLAEIVAPSLAGPCIDERGTSVQTGNGSSALLVDREGELSEEQVPRLKAHRLESLARALFTPYDRSAGLLLYGAIGLVVVLLLETASAMIVLDNSFIDAFYGAAKTLVTVDPNLDVDDGPGWNKLFISATMLVALIFAAAFTAGLVNRVVERRLTGLAGRRAVPRRDHVVVAGLGQVGMQLCLLLRDCGIPVVVIEQDDHARNIGRARELGLPLVIGRASDHSLMGRLSLDRARAVAAVTGDDLENIATAITARAIEEDIRVVLRVGDAEIANETRSMLALGLVRDVHRIAAALIAAKALGDEADEVVCLGEEAYLRFPDGGLREVPAPAVAS